MPCECDDDWITTLWSLGGNEYLMRCFETPDDGEWIRHIIKYHSERMEEVRARDLSMEDTF
jgi:hypothetical protein